jgi:hypothetical protein
VPFLHILTSIHAKFSRLYVNSHCWSAYSSNALFAGVNAALSLSLALLLVFSSVQIQPSSLGDIGRLSLVVPTSEDFAQTFLFLTPLWLTGPDSEGVFSSTRWSKFAKLRIACRCRHNHTHTSCSRDNSQSGQQANKPGDKDSSHSNWSQSKTSPMMLHFLKETAKESYFAAFAMKNDAKEKDGDKSKLPGAGN